jgi:hypothetical protein
VVDHLPSVLQDRKPPAEREPLDRATLRLVADRHLADIVKKRLELEPPFFLWLEEVAS